MSEEEYYQEMYEDFQRNYEESKQEYERYKQEREMYDDVDTSEDSVFEDCYADYSGGKKPTMECDYYTVSSSSKTPKTYNSIVGWSVMLAVAVGIIIFAILKSKKQKNL